MIEERRREIQDAEPGLPGLTEEIAGLGHGLGQDEDIVGGGVIDARPAELPKDHVHVDGRGRGPRRTILDLL